MKADLKLALAKRHPEYAGCEIDANTERCIVKMKRRNENGTEEAITSTFTIEDAKRAGLFPKKDNWRMYPQRMLKARAISYAVNDLFPDIVFGMLSSEEAQDIDRHTEKTMAEYEIIESEAETTDRPDAETTDQPNRTNDEFAELMAATQGVMQKLVDNKIDGFDNEVRRHSSIQKHLGCSMIAECTNFHDLYEYHNHLAAILRGANAKPTIKERQVELIERMTKLATGEELEEWLPKIQGATRHSALDDVEAWLDKNKTSLEGDSK
ncbi:MAG TPA: hypothetical protein PLK07_10120 [Rectinema sp.]|nr:hypothetical protein [Rectinema sp.]